MTDKTASVPPENTTSALSHLAFCALAPLGLARQDGRHLHSVTFRVVGDADRFMHVMAEYGLRTRRQGSTSACHTIALEPA